MRPFGYIWDMFDNMLQTVGLKSARERCNGSRLLKARNTRRATRRNQIDCDLRNKNITAATTTTTAATKATKMNRSARAAAAASASTTTITTTTTTTTATITPTTTPTTTSSQSCLRVLAKHGTNAMPLAKRHMKNADATTITLQEISKLYFTHLPLVTHDFFNELAARPAGKLKVCRSMSDLIDFQPLFFQPLIWPVKSKSMSQLQQRQTRRFIHANNNKRTKVIAVDDECCATTKCCHCHCRRYRSELPFLSAALRRLAPAREHYQLAVHNSGHRLVTIRSSASWRMNVNQMRQEIKSGLRRIRHQLSYADTVRRHPHTISRNRMVSGSKHQQPKLQQHQQQQPKQLPYKHKKISQGHEKLIAIITY